MGGIAVYYMVMSHQQASNISHALYSHRPVLVHLTEVTVEPAGVRLQLTTTAPAAACPRCAVPSSSVHSRYQRHLTDLPWGPLAGPYPAHGAQIRLPESERARAASSRSVCPSSSLPMRARPIG